MDKSDLVSAVALVDKTIDQLRYFGQKEDNEFSGESISISLVMLPGLLLDLRINSLLNREKKEPVCSLGGKASRTAKILWGLLSPEDEIIEPYLIAKTSPLGALMLRNELSGTSARKLFDAKYQDFIQVDNSIIEPRCAARLYEEEIQLESCTVKISLRDKGSHHVVLPKAYTVNHELSSTDLKERLYSKPLLKNARAILLASMTTPCYSELYKTIIEHIQPGMAKLFLDVGRHIEYGRIEEQIKLLKTDSSKICCVFVPVRVLRNSSIDERKQFEKLWSWSKVPMISYGDNKTVMLIKDDTGRLGQINLPGEIDFSKENVSEAFKAGIILARSIHMSIYDVSDTEGRGNLRAYLLSQWQNAWETYIAFGVALAKHVEKHTISKGMRKLVEEYCAETPEAVPFDPGDKPSAKFESISGYKSLSFTQAHLNNLVRYFSCRREKKLECPDLSLCSKPECEGGCMGKGSKSSRKRAAVLLDLDGTLINSEVQRRRMVSKAFSVLLTEMRCFHKKDLCPLNTAIDYFQKYVYNLWPLYKKYKIGNFRQHWNHAGWYAGLLVFLMHKTCFNDMKKWYAREDISETDTDKLKKMKVSDIDWLPNFKSYYDSTIKEYQNEIQRAQHVFNQTKIYPYGGVIDFLESLRLTDAFELYVVTEGETDTQRMKITNSGLKKYFDENHVLTTSDAGEPIRELEKLAWETDLLVSESEEAKHSYEKAQSSLEDLNRLSDDVLQRLLDNNEYESEIKQIVDPHKKKLLKLRKTKEAQKKRIVEILEVAKFAKAVINRLAQKSGKAYYAAVIRAILRDPFRALEELKSFENLMNDVPPENRMKFVMIGDRQDNDIEWPKKLLGEKLLAIRVISSKYAKDPKQKESATAGVEPKYQPDYIVHTIEQAKLLLLNKNIWDEIKCIQNTPVFDWRIEYSPSNWRSKTSTIASTPSIGMEYILLGIELHTTRYGLIHKICSRVLCDFLATLSDSEVSIVLGGVLDSAKSCVARKAGVLNVISKGLIAKAIIQVSERHIAWLEKIIDDLGVKNQEHFDPLFQDRYDQSYHMQQCIETILTMCNSLSKKQQQLIPKMCSLKTKIETIVKSDPHTFPAVTLGQCRAGCNHL
ncbi:MAG: HAD hydrolase-like protein [Chitinivibrionales bacterium]|nr:HAD hydrolase-like protein [Chitinivibrionales bacterium]